MKALVRRIVPFPVRRAVWRVRRSVPRVARPLSAVLPRAEPPARPIFVIGCPRAGTSALQELLLASPELASVHNEGHILWDEFHHPRDRGWDSDALGREDVGERERAYIYLAVKMFAGGAFAGGASAGGASAGGASARAQRFADKTAESCLRIPYLDELFPDATFVFIRRDAPGTVNSLIEAWRARPRFVKYRLPESLDGLGELSGNRWSFALIPGWRRLRDAPLEEVCARQYVACNEAALDAFEGLAPARRIDVSYDELVSEPVAAAARLYERLGLELGPEARLHAEGLARNPSSTALTAPRPEKWKDQNREAVERIMPLVAATERRLGLGP